MTKMTRLAIIDHATHSLFIEDVSDEDLAKYNGEEEAYIRDNYSLQGEFSWDFITNIQYLQEENKDPIDASDLETAFV